jgi:hypothetical protein
MSFATEKTENSTAPTVESADVQAKMPLAGPHARPEITNFEACPGAGALPSEQELGGESDPGAG